MQIDLTPNEITHITYCLGVAEGVCSREIGQARSKELRDLLTNQIQNMIALTESIMNKFAEQ